MVEEKGRTEGNLGPFKSTRKDINLGDIPLT